MDVVGSWSRHRLVAGAVAGAWVTLFLPPDSRAAAWLAVPLCVGGIALVPPRPVVGTTLVLAAAATCAWSDVPFTENAMLLPIALALAWLGRHTDGIAAGLVLISAFAIVKSSTVGAPWFSPAVWVALYGASWMFGRAVRVRSTAAAEAAREAARLADVDLDRVMATSVLASRRHVADEALSMLREAVGHMRVLARRAAGADAGDPHLVRAIQRRGEQAMSELHRILRLLEPVAPRLAAPDSRQETRGPTRLERHVAPMRAGLGAVVVLIGSLAATAVVAGGAMMLMIGTAAVATGAAVAARFPLAGGVVSAAGFGTAALGPDFVLDGLLPLTACFGLVVWRIAAQRQRAARAGLAFTLAGAVVLGGQFGSPGVGFALTLVAMTTWASRAWRESVDVMQAEQARAAVLTAGVAAAKRRADRQERRRIARELHDGVSHGIAAMVLQAQAALAHHRVDPERARQCLALASDTGLRTLHEIEALALDWDDRSGEHLSLLTLIDGLRLGGVPIQVRVEGGRTDPVTYRIVQEALTNVTRYAPGAHVWVEAGDDGPDRYVRVVDSGPADRRTPATAMEGLGRGRGLAGLSARVAGLGGEFDAGPRDRGPGPSVPGFAVDARWPREPGRLTDEPSATAALVHEGAVNP